MKELELSTALETPTPERIPPSFYMFQSLNGEEKKTLKERVDKFGGLVRIFVHPYYEDHPEPSTAHLKGDAAIRKNQSAFKTMQGVFQEKTYKQEKIKEVLKKLLEGDTDSVPVTVIFEEENNIVGIIDILSQELNARAERKIFLIPTKSGSGSLDKETEITVNDNFREIGASRFMISGNYLLDTPNENLRGCVETVMKQLQQVGKIENSALVYPADRLIAEK
ncbi:MAG: hypothetical protein V4509_05770 [Patescibacteria group bacterium]